MTKLAFKTVVFSLIVVTLIKIGVDPAFKKSNSFQNSINDLYQLDKEAVDILVLGSSHARNSYNTELIDKALEVNSYSLASGGQKIVVTNNLLEDILRDIKPKLVILDVFPGSLDFPYKDHQKGNQLQVFDNTKWTLNKLKLLRSIYSSGELPAAISPMIRNHKDWNKANWTFTDEELDSSRAFFNKGFSGSFTIIDDKVRVNLLDYKQRKENYLKLDKNEIDPFKLKDEIEQIKKAIEICKMHNIELLLVSSPYFDAYYSKLASNFHFLVQDLCRESGVKFLDFNTKFDELGLSMTDFRDRSHVNILGADKVTSSLVNYLVEEQYITVDESRRENLPTILSDLRNKLELTYEKRLQKEILPNVIASHIAIYNNKNFRQIELVLNQSEGVDKLIKNYNLEYIASPFEKDKRLLKGKFKKLNRELYTFYNSKASSIDGQSKIILRVYSSSIGRYENIRIFSFEKGKRQTGKKYTIDLPNVDLTNVIEPKINTKAKTTTNALISEAQKIFANPFDFNKAIQTEGISYFNTKDNEYTVLLKLSNKATTHDLAKYIGYIRYYNGEVEDANKKVKSFPLRVLENGTDKYIFATLKIPNLEISKFDIFFLERTSKKPSKFFSTKDLKLKKNAS